MKEMPSSGSCITYKILNSLIPPRDSSYLQACLIKVLLQWTRIIHDRHSNVISKTLQNILCFYLRRLDNAIHQINRWCITFNRNSGLIFWLHCVQPSFLICLENFPTLSELFLPILKKFLMFWLKIKCPLWTAMPRYKITFFIFILWDVITCL